MRSLNLKLVKFADLLARIFSTLKIDLNNTDKK